MIEKYIYVEILSNDGESGFFNDIDMPNRKKYLRLCGLPCVRGSAKLGEEGPGRGM